MGPCSQASVPTICLHSSTQEWFCWDPEGSWADGKLFLLYYAELSENLQELMVFPCPEYRTWTSFPACGCRRL